MAIEFGPAKTAAPLAPSAKTGAPAAPSRRFSMNTKITFGSRSVSVTERMVFTERLALLLETGVSLAEAVKVLQDQAEDPLLAGILTAVAANVSEGNAFSVALARHPEMFSRTYVSLVAAAEDGGFLPEVLEQLHAMDEKNSELRGNIIAALSYPAFLIFFSIAVVIFVLVVIFPKFEDLFASIHDQLPASTIALMFLSDMLRKYWWLILPLLGGGLALLAVWLRTPAGKRALDQLKLRTPVIKDIFIQMYLNQTLGVLGMSLANGVPITAALRAAQGVVDNCVFFDFLQTVQRHVNEGRGIAAGFVEEPLIPPMVKQMIATGDQTGNLAKVMTRVAEFYGRELKQRVATLAKVVEPVMLLVMGVVVGLIVISLILPIFKLSRAVH
jgi:type II secretory pathway component PulF